MRPCDTHWVQMRDKYEASGKLLTANIVFQGILLNEKKLAEVFGNIYKLQDAIHADNGCPLCFYQKHLQQDPIAKIDEALNK